MLIVGNTLVSEELLEEQFVCDLRACKGACCVEGSSGAPLEVEEIDSLEEVIEEVRPYMRAEGLKAIAEQGLYKMDEDGDLVTTLVDGNKECSFVFFDEQSIAKCALEKAYNEGKTNWKKPISCHLYPVRLQKLPDYTAVNYHRWQVCKPACKCGAELKVPVYRFLNEPLKRKFGHEWFAELEAISQHRKDIPNR
ncbi:MAG: DUF3109 family protein [Flavobacteriales bacterium]